MNSKYSNETYIIAEIGQNHNGDIGICKALIDQLVEPLYDSVSNNRLNSINAVKLIKRDLDEELSAEMMDKPYDSIHSFGKTFREHRQVLELSYKALRTILWIHVQFSAIKEYGRSVMCKISKASS